jgi:hypothetical protein
VRTLTVGPGGGVTQKRVSRALALEVLEYAVLGGVLVSCDSAREEVRRVASPKTWTEATPCLN